MALSIIPSDPNSATKAFADLKQSWTRIRLPKKQLKLKSVRWLGQLKI
jgi:hypothetical protein